MSYTKTDWSNSTAPAINDTNLNKIENGIKNNDSALGYEDYDNTQTYIVGSHCIYNNKLYVCITAVESAEDFDSTKWSEVNVKTILNTLQTEITSLQTKTQNFQTYYSAWGSSVTFYVPSGRHAIVIVSQNTFYIVWNPSSAVEWGAVYGSGLSFTRDSSDTTKITGTRSGNATWTVIVF